MNKPTEHSSVKYLCSLGYVSFTMDAWQLFPSPIIDKTRHIKYDS